MLSRNKLALLHRHRPTDAHGQIEFSNTGMKGA